MYWVEQVERLIHRTITEDTDLKEYIKLRCYPGELSELPDPEYPLICFKIEPKEETYGYLEGDVRLWIWCKDTDPRIFNIFKRVKELFDHQRLVMEDIADRTVSIVFSIGEPIRNVQTDFGVQTLLSRTTFKGLET